VLEGNEWLMNTVVSGSAARAAADPRQSVIAVVARNFFKISSR